MKKLLIISISIIIVLALSISVMAKAVELELLTETNTPCAEIETGSGKVILNNPAGKINFVVQVNLKGAALEAYDVWIYAGGASLLPLERSSPTSDWYKLGVLETNKAGNGTLHCNVKLDISEVLLGGIVVALNPEGSKECNSFMTEFPGSEEIFIK